MYADFEGILSKNKKSTSTNTEVIQQGQPCGLCYHIVNTTDEYFEPLLNRGQDTSAVFCTSIINKIAEIFQRPSIPIDNSTGKGFKSEQNCYSCTKPFENYRKVCLNIYLLDPAFHLTAPGLAWDAMLMTTGVSLELLSNVDILQFIELGLYGEISSEMHRYSEATHKHLDTYDPSKESKLI